MTEAVQEILSSFDRLPESDQHGVYREILKRAHDLDYLALSDEDFAKIVDETFQMYDAEEEIHGRG